MLVGRKILIKILFYLLFNGGFCSDSLGCFWRREIIGKDFNIYIWCGFEFARIKSLRVVMFYMGFLWFIVIYVVFFNEDVSKGEFWLREVGGGSVFLLFVKEIIIFFLYLFLMGRCKID